MNYAEARGRVRGASKSMREGVLDDAEFAAVLATVVEVVCECMIDIAESADLIATRTGTGR